FKFCLRFLIVMKLRVRRGQEVACRRKCYMFLQKTLKYNNTFVRFILSQQHSSLHQPSFGVVGVLFECFTGELRSLIKVSAVEEQVRQPSLSSFLPWVLL